MNKDILLLNFCLRDQLFCSMYSGLQYAHTKLGLQKPHEVWIEALRVMKLFGESARPEILIDSIFDAPYDDKLPVLMTLMYMLATGNQCAKPNDLADRFCEMINECRHCDELYHEIRKTEGKEEQKDRNVPRKNYMKDAFSEISCICSEPSADMHEFVTEALTIKDSTFYSQVELVLQRQNSNDRYQGEIERLQSAQDKLGTTYNTTNMENNNGIVVGRDAKLDLPEQLAALLVDNKNLLS